MSEWRDDFENAPKDGTMILVAEPQGGFDLAHWHKDHFCGELGGWTHFTHWMPLPDPPTQGREG